MDLAPCIALAVIVLVTVAGNAFWPSRTKRINRALAAKPRVLVHEAHGTVRLTGRVRRVGELLQAPLSGRPCVAYEIFVDEPGGSGPGMAAWRRRLELRDARPFLVEDESGAARIDTSGPFLMALDYDRAGITGGSPYPGKHQALQLLLASMDIGPTSGLFGWKRFRYGEGVLEEGELVSVSAASALEVDPTGDRPGLRSLPQRLVLRGTEALPLLISDGRTARSEPGSG